MKQSLKDRIRLAAMQDKEILVSREQVESTLGQDPRYLQTLGLEKSDLIQLERLGLAIKARYATTNKAARWAHLEEDKRPTGPQRVRWIILQGAAE